MSENSLSLLCSFEHFSLRSQFHSFNGRFRLAKLSNNRFHLPTALSKYTNTSELWTMSKGKGSFELVSSPYSGVMGESATLEGQAVDKGVFEYKAALCNPHGEIASISVSARRPLDLDLSNGQGISWTLLQTRRLHYQSLVPLKVKFVHGCVMLPYLVAVDRVILLTAQDEPTPLRYYVQAGISPPSLPDMFKQIVSSAVHGIPSLYKYLKELAVRRKENPQTAYGDIIDRDYALYRARLLAAVYRLVQSLGGLPEDPIPTPGLSIMASITAWLASTPSLPIDLSPLETILSTHAFTPGNVDYLVEKLSGILPTLDPQRFDQLASRLHYPGAGTLSLYNYSVVRGDAMVKFIKQQILDRHICRDIRIDRERVHSEQYMRDNLTTRLKDVVVSLLKDVDGGTQVRALWPDGHSVSALVPEMVLRELQLHPFPYLKPPRVYIQCAGSPAVFQTDKNTIFRLDIDRNGINVKILSIPEHDVNIDQYSMVGVYREKLQYSRRRSSIISLLTYKQTVKITEIRLETGVEEEVLGCTDITSIMDQDKRTEFIERMSESQGTSNSFTAFASSSSSVVFIMSKNTSYEHFIIALKPNWSYPQQARVNIKQVKWESALFHPADAETSPCSPPGIICTILEVKNNLYPLFFSPRSLIFAIMRVTPANRIIDLGFKRDSRFIAQFKAHMEYSTKSPPTWTAIDSGNSLYCIALSPQTVEDRGERGGRVLRFKLQ